MAVNIMEDIKTISELKTHTRELVQQAQSTHRPVVITVKGKPAAVLLDAAEYERLTHGLQLAGLLARGEADVQAGKTRPARAFLKELRSASKVRR